MEEKLYSTTEIAEALSVTDAYVRILIKAGKARPFRKVGNNWLFNQEELDRLRNRKTRPGRPKK